MKGKIYAYRTHYEIMDYSLGDVPQLEKSLSVWDDTYYKSTPSFYYDTDKRILYVPRGYDPNKLSSFFDSFIDFMDDFTSRKKITFNIQLPPRNDKQKEAVRFLACKNEFSYLMNDGQAVLSMPPGEGKTYCAISALSILGYRSMVIVNTNTLGDQWKANFVKYTGIPENYVVVLKKYSDFGAYAKKHKRELERTVAFIVTHASLQGYMRENGLSSLNELFDKLNIGVKIFDEAHLVDRNTLMIDYMTNVWKTFYLSATFARSDEKENKVFQKSFNMVHKMNVKSSAEKHVVYIAYIYSTKPTPLSRESIRGKKGFDRYRYIDYELGTEEFFSIIKKLLGLFIEKLQLEGKIMILSSKKESCNILFDFVQELYPAYKSCFYHSDNKIEDYKEYGIICATPQMLGTGADIPGLRVLINTEPMRSKVNTKQFFGRLRPYGEGKLTYYVELVDRGFPIVYDMYKSRKKIIETLAKEIKIIDETVIKY